MATPAAQSFASESAAAATGVTRVSAAWWAVIAVAFVALHVTFLRRMYHIATDHFNADWSHAVALPFIVGWLVWRERRGLASAAGSPSWLGIPMMLGGILAYLAGIYPVRNDMAQGYAMLVTLAGVVLLTHGTKGLRVVAMPIVILAMGVKISDRWWEEIAWRLQVLAANGAAAAMQLVAVDARVDGAVINIRQPVGATIDVNVAEACSGLRMLMSFIVLTVLVAFVPPRRPWQRFVLVVLAVPIAVMVNILRVAVLGIAFARGATWATDAMHEVIGLIMLVPALLMLLAVAWMLDRLFIDASPNLEGDQGTHRESQTKHGVAIVPRASPRARVFAAALACGSGAAMVAGTCAVIAFSLLTLSQPHDGLPTRTTSIAAAVLAAAVALAAVLVLRRVWPKSLGASRSAIGHACAAGMLLAAAVGLGTSIRVSGAVFYKAPVPLRHPFTLVATELSRWNATTRQPVLADGVLDELRARDVLYRAYAQRSESDSTHDALLHLAYYTGTVDTVPHVPERCFLAQGFRSLGTSRVTLDLSGHDEPDGIPSSIPATLFEFEQGPGVGRVIYFFIANGRFLASPEELRLRAFDWRERTAYYCKVELTLSPRASGDETLADASAFLRDVLPSIVDCLPALEAESPAHEARR